MEADRLEQVRSFLEIPGIDVILLDNMKHSELREAVALGRGKVKFEASGGVTLKNVRQIAATGVDYISVGALTHSAHAIDISLEVTHVGKLSTGHRLVADELREALGDCRMGNQLMVVEETPSTNDLAGKPKNEARPKDSSPSPSGKPPAAVNMGAMGIRTLSRPLVFRVAPAEDDHWPNRRN